MNSDDDKPQESCEGIGPLGYRNPPKTGRFKPGVSGNPRGRPKGSLNVTSAFTKALREKVIINEHGQRKTITKFEASLKQLVNKAASGDSRAMRQLLELAREAEAKHVVSSAQQPDLNDLDQKVMVSILKRFPGIESGN